MEVTLLGTGAADGWPNPWCTCASCTDARHRTQLDRPLAVVGPPPVLEEYRPWLAPDDPVVLTGIAPGETLVCGGHRTRALAAEHGARAVPDGTTLVAGPRRAALTGSA